MSSAGVGPLCFLKSTVNAAIYQDILEHFMLPSADKLYGDTDFISQQDLAPAHTDKGTKSWFNDHGVTGLTGQQTRLYCQEEDERHQTQQCRWPEGRYQSNLGFQYINSCKKEAQPSIECIEINIIFRSLTFLFKISLFIDLM